MYTCVCNGTIKAQLNLYISKGQDVCYFLHIYTSFGTAEQQQTLYGLQRDMYLKCVNHAWIKH